MPKVGDKEYTYDEAGQAAAKKESMKTGEPVIQTYDAGGRVKKIEGVTTDTSTPQYMGGYKDGGKVEKTKSQKLYTRASDLEHKAEQLRQKKGDKAFKESRDKMLKRGWKDDPDDPDDTVSIIARGEKVQKQREVEKKNIIYKSKMKKAKKLKQRAAKQAEKEEKK